MTKNSLLKKADKFLSPVLAHYTNIEIEKGKGVYLFDFEGKKYLDFASGIATNSTGHCHPHVISAAINQTKKLIHACTGIVYYESNVALAEKLAKLLPEKNWMSFFCQSGTEAVEAAIKLAKYTTGKQSIIAFKGGFHGRTLGSLSLTTSKQKYRQGYEPLLPNIFFAPYAYCYRCKFNKNTQNCSFECLEETEKLIKKAGAKKIAAMIVEPIQGEGGYIVPPKEFIKGLRVLCNKYNLLLVFDEVQTGIGRTGKMFAFEHFGVVPDIICLAKGIASGFPLGAVIAPPELMKKWSPGAHGGTLSGNPVSCAAGFATLEVIEKEKLLQNSAQQGKMIKNHLIKLQKKSTFIGDVRGLGLMVAVEFIKDSKKTPNPEIVKKIRKKCLENGLILISCGTHDQVIRFVPPLIVEKEHLEETLKIFESSLANSVERGA
jgi:4-aminobutyrate aminotransferase